jgi:hypothetical protein
MSPLLLQVCYPFSEFFSSTPSIIYTFDGHSFAAVGGELYLTRALGGWWGPEEAAGPMTSRAIGLSWVVDRYCTDVDDGGRWLGGGMEELGCARD